VKYKLVLIAGLAVFGLAWSANATGMQRIGHNTLTPRHSNPDDKGMYAGLIDPTNGYAYFAGNYLFKLDITGNLPVQAGPSLLAGQPAHGAIDPAAGYLYLAKNTVSRYALGAGTNAITTAGSLTLAAGSAAEIVTASHSMNELTNVMLDATIEQKRGGETVVKATDSIADVARQNLQVVEGINLAVRELASEAEMLRKRVEAFTV